ncbi:MAG: hypothetical protein LBH97_00240 [Treponema sp.]|jgi:hypothetical protein|nr:hypothetical protein [Treponema sp.]
MNIRRIAPVLLFVTLVSGLFAQGRDGSAGGQGDTAAAQQYVLWAQREIAEDRWPQALAGLERAADYTGVSSDISYLLALARAHEGGSRGAVLDALTRAFATDRWLRYSEPQARLLEAEQFIVLRNYSGALASLAAIPDSADAAVLRLGALKGLVGNRPSAGPMTYNGAENPSQAEFRRRMLEAFERYPRDTRPLRILFDYAAKRNPDENDLALMEIALRRLPFVLEADSELAWMAAPFISDEDEARRLISAYRAGGLQSVPDRNFRPAPGSIAPALYLGLISEEAAVAELFSSAEIAPDAEKILDRDLILSVSDLIYGDAGQRLFAEQLLSFSGIIIADDDQDGYPESRVVYRDGMVFEYICDADQDRIAELRIFFSAGIPLRAEQFVPAEAGMAAVEAYQGSRLAVIFWERYPAVQQVEMDGALYVPAPGGFQFTPLRFIELAANETWPGLRYPQREVYSPRINRRSLAAASIMIQRPSEEFQGVLETIELRRGIPLRATETFNGRIVSITEFEQGWPVIQRLDFDLDSRMETQRHFRRPSAGEDPLDYRRYIISSQSDWDGDGVFEYEELYLEDGSVVYSWDMDGDGIREYSERRTGNNR